MTDIDESIGVRELSHDTTKVLKELEANPRLVQVTKHGRIVALLVPASVPALVRRWAEVNPQRSGSIVGSRGNLQNIHNLTTPTDPAIVAIGVKEFQKATSEYLRRAEEGEIVLVRRHAEPIFLLVSFSLPELVRMSIQSR